jgi:hypothetical protein
MAALLRSDVMRSYGISGHLERIRLVERYFDSLYVHGCNKLDWYVCVPILNKLRWFFYQ